MRCVLLCPSCFWRATRFTPTRLALLKRYWLVFFRAPWSGTARCRPGRWMVTLGLWKWAFMRYVGYFSVFTRDVEACDVTVWLCLDHRTYCNTEEQHEHRHLTQIQAIKLFMTGRRPHLKCNRHLSHTYINQITWNLFCLWWIQKRWGFGSKGLYLSLLHYCTGDRELIQEVLFDAVVTAPLEAYWTGLALNKSE